MTRSLRALLLTLLAAPTLAAEPPVAITNVSILPMDAERVLPAQTVVIADGRLAALGSSAAIEVPAEATVIDHIPSSW